jgi:hypothetical protein
MKATHNEQILLLTATINPLRGIDNLRHIDPDARLREYAKALAFYLSQMKANERLVFCENSGSDLSELQKVVAEHGAQERVEFLSFFGNDFPPSNGRGYGEFKLIQYAMENSRFIRHSSPTETAIWKITGRYIVSNLRYIIDSAPGDFKVYCNYRDYPKKGWMDLYLVAWTPEGWNHYLDQVYHELIDSPDGLVVAEHMVRRRLDARGFKGPCRLRATPELVGVRGADAKGYHSGKNRYKFMLRKTLRVVTPWLWI